MALLTEDRKLTGIMGVLSRARQHDHRQPAEVLPGGLPADRRIDEGLAQAQREALALKTPSLDQLIQNLSGGNQQKVLISRWLLTLPDILMIDEPTRGIDVGAKSEIHRLMSMLAQQGKAIIMVSSEMPEILGMSDRVVVMHEGQCQWGGRPRRRDPGTNHATSHRPCGPGCLKGISRNDHHHYRRGRHREVRHRRAS